MYMYHLTRYISVFLCTFAVQNVEKYIKQRKVETAEHHICIIHKFVFTVNSQ